jgi:cytochrome c oxidase subunit 3
LSVVAQAHATGAHADEYQWHTSLNRMGMWLFILSEVFMFAALFLTRFYLWGNTRPDVDQALGLTITAILLLSSVSMNRAETAIAYDDRKNFLRYLIVTAVLGSVFLFGVVGIEWQGHIRPSDGAYGAVLYMMTGVHALHVLSGVILILWIWNLGRKGSFSAERHWGVEATAVYWHFVDVVWVFFYPALYLLGHVTAGH